MRLFPSNKNLTREQLEERFDKAAAKFLQSRDTESRREVIELHDQLKELDDEKERVQIPVLQLRDHRMLKQESGHVVWPPVWLRMGDNKPSPLTGEIGYLAQVLTNPASEKLLFLIITHQASQYMGAMVFDDPIFCGQLSELLKSKIGLSIKEIGDLDLSHLL